jgi:membrane protein required for colicin V production
MDIAVLDIIFGIIIFLVVIRCIIKGFIAEIMALAALILGIGLAVVFFQMGARVLENYFGPSDWNQVIAFLIIFLVVYVIIKLFENAIHRLFERLRLGSLDRALGFFLGIAEGIIIIAVIIIIMRLQPFFEVEELINESVIAGIMLQIIPYGIELLEEKV